jgi:Tol biopolymer transport system component
VNDCERGVGSSLSAIDWNGSPREAPQWFGDLADIFDPAWAPKGNEIAFAAEGGKCRKSQDDPDNSGIYVARPDGSGARRVAKVKIPSDPAWSPDGKWLACVSDISRYNDYASEVWVVCRTEPRSAGLRRCLTVKSTTPVWLRP